MINSIFEGLGRIDEFYWAHIGCTILLLAGAYLTWRSGFYQARSLVHLPKTIRNLLNKAKEEKPGVSPLRLIFASAGGMIGLGNIVAVVTALIVGGPGAIFWLWVAALVGVIIKYTETYIGLKYRKIRKDGKGYDGGPMYYIPHAFKGRLGKGLAYLVAFLLCIYGVEVYQFTVVADSLASVLPIGHEWIVVALLGFTIYVGMGGVGRLANVCSFLMPLFIVGYSLMCLWVIILNISVLPGALLLIMKSAFTGTGAVGGFAGASVLMAMQQGAARAVYSADIAIGFDSIVQSESQEICPQQQARTAMMSTLIDVTTCTMTLLLLMVTGVWQAESGTLQNTQYVITALKQHFPGNIEYLFTGTVFIVGCATVQAYFVVGLKAAHYLSSRWGRAIYIIYAIIAFWGFSHYDPSKVMLIMSLSGGLLIFINIVSLLRLRKQVSYEHLDEVEDSIEELEESKECAIVRE